MAHPITPEDIDADHAPRRREDLPGLEVDGEVVLYEPRGGSVHRLDRIASVLWNCFDGSATVRELGEDLAAVFDEHPARVHGDVLDYVQELGRQGLLQGVRQVEEESPFS